MRVMPALSPIQSDDPIAAPFDSSMDRPFETVKRWPCIQVGHVPAQLFVKFYQLFSLAGNILGIEAKLNK